MLMTIPNLPSLTSEVPFDNPPSTTQTQATQTRSREAEMAAQYYAKRVEETPRTMVLPALAAAIAPGPQQDGRYRSPYASIESQRPPNVLAPIAPMAPTAPMNMSQHGTPEPGPPRHFATLSANGRTSSESQTDEHHEPPKPTTIPGNNQYTPGVQRVSHPGTPQPTGPSNGTKQPRPRPHVCLTCQRTFARREHLNRHELSHTKEKPFECNECSRCFSRRDLLLRHKQKLHITNPYVRPRDRVKGGDGQDEDESSMQPMAPMRSEDDGINVPIAVHPSGHVQDGGSNQQGDDRGAPSQMAIAHMRPALPPSCAPQDHGHPQQQGPSQPKPAGSAASLYYQKQDYDLSKVDLSQFRSFSRSPRPPGTMPTGPPPGPPPVGYQSGGPSPQMGQARRPPPPQGAPIPVSPNQLHREPPHYAEGPGPSPINHDPEESGFNIPFAKRPRRDTDGRSRNNQTLRHQTAPPPGPAQSYPHAHPQLPHPNDRYEPPHSLLDQFAIAAVPDPSRSYPSFQEQPYDPRGPPPSQHDIEMAQASQREVDVWRSPGGTHRVVQFERPLPKIQTAEEAREASFAAREPSLAAPGQQRSPSRKRSLQEENDHEAEVASSAQGGYRRSMRRALSMSMEDGQRPNIPIPETLTESKAKSKAAEGKKGKKAPTPEEDRENKSGKPNVRYVKAASSRSSLKEKKEEKKPASPVRGCKPSAKAKAAQEEEETPKRGRGRPPKSASKATPASSKKATPTKGKRSAKAVEEEVDESESEEEELSENEQAAVEEQLLQEEKRVTRGLREAAAKKVKETKGSKKEDKKEEEQETMGRTFRSVRLQAKHMK